MIRDLILTPMGLRVGARVYPCSIGRGGLRSDKAEGDGATPVGIHNIVGMYYRADRIARPTLWAEPIGPSDLWSDASGEPDYNHHVRGPYGHSHETLRRADPLYDLIIVTDWNWPYAQAGRGSAIFIHQWRRPHYQTAGCIGLSRAHLHQIARLVTLRSRLIVSANNPAHRK